MNSQPTKNKEIQRNEKGESSRKIEGSIGNINEEQKGMKNYTRIERNQAGMV